MSAPPAPAPHESPPLAARIGLVAGPILYRAGVSDAVFLFMPIAATAFSVGIYALFARRSPRRRPRGASPRAC